VGVAKTLCAQTEHKRREDESHHSLFRGSEKKPLPDLIELGTPAFFLFQRFNVEPMPLIGPAAL
jgi:hypothetical protein